MVVKTGTRRTLEQAVTQMGEEHPPIDLGSVDYTVHDPGAVNARYGEVLDYLCRVELEVERNLKELQVLLPDAPEVDRVFIHQVWGPQELRHGAILEQWGRTLGRTPPPVDSDSVSPAVRALGALGHLRQCRT